MRTILGVLFVLGLTACREEPAAKLSAQAIVDKSIGASGGNGYKTNDITFEFRNKTYFSKKVGGERWLGRTFQMDSLTIKDVRKPSGFTRYSNDSVVSIPDSLAHAYSNSVNSVHYFVQLPYGLNDAAVNKKLVGEIKIGENTYYKVKVTFDRKGGGDDFEDTYMYWFNKATFKPDYLAYDFKENGGGIRFRKAYNERDLKGMRFVDYENYRADKNTASVSNIDSLYLKDKLKLLSKIVIENIVVKKSTN